MVNQGLAANDVIQIYNVYGQEYKGHILPQVPTGRAGSFKTPLLNLCQLQVQRSWPAIPLLQIHHLPDAALFQGICQVYLP